MQLSLAVLAAAVSQAVVSTASTLTPPVLPLIVRNPYLSTWLGNAREAPWVKWPMFYTGEEVGLSLMAHVPSQGVVYPLIGRPQDSLASNAGYVRLGSSFNRIHKLMLHSRYHVQYPEYLGHNYDASTTNFTYRVDTGAAKSLDITVSFLSPITPTSTLRQSIPASYVTIDVRGNVDVNVYMDIDGRWVSGDGGSILNWQWATLNVEDATNGTSDNGRKSVLQSWQIRRDRELDLSEIRDRAEWGTLHFTGPDVSDSIPTSISCLTHLQLLTGCAV